MFILARMRPEYAATGETGAAVVTGSVLGPWNWWLPEWLARILRVEPSPLTAKGEAKVNVPVA